MTGGPRGKLARQVLGTFNSSSRQSIRDIRRKAMSKGESIDVVMFMLDDLVRRGYLEQDNESAGIYRLSRRGQCAIRELSALERT